MRQPLRRAGLGVLAVSMSGAAALAPISADAAVPAVHHSARAAHQWQATATQGLRFKGTRVGATPDARKLRLAVNLAPRNQDRLDAAAKAMYTPGSKSYHHFLTAAQYRNRFSPTAASVAQVTAYLHRQGLTGVHVAGNRLLVTADATVGSAERAFATSLVNYRVGHRVMFANRTSAKVPAYLSHLVNSVSGLSNFKAKVAAAPRAAGLPSTDGLFPAQFQTTYDAAGTATGSGTAIAVLTEGDISQVVPDLRTAEQAQGLPQVPVTKIQVGPAGTDVAGLDEWDMDTQAASGMAQNVQQMYLYNVTSLSNADIISGINRFVADNKAPAMSASLGECELFAGLSGDEAAVDTVLQEGQLQGQTLMASTGDEGSACSLVLPNTGTPVGVQDVEWPAASTNTLAVGGTSLVSDTAGNRVLEPAWLGGGGGTSTFETPGVWTKGTDPLYSVGLRALPDIALDADGNTTPVKVYVNGVVTYIGGTSLSSPLMLGVWARLESAHGNHLGLAGPALYGVYTKVNPSLIGIPKAVPGFYDVVLGTNGLYDATPGWDYTTGLGTPDVKQLVTALG